MCDSETADVKDDREIARAYDEIATEVFETSSLYEDAYRLVPDVRGRVLDIGCGQGRFLEIVAERGVSIESLEGCDLSPRMCEMARDRVPGAHITVDSGERLDEFDDDSFDVVYMLCSLSNMQRHADALRAANRVLVERGRLGIVVPNRDWWLYDRWLANHTQFQPVDDHFFRIAEIEALLVEAGFDPGPARGVWALLRDGWRHRVELAVARVIPLLHRRMKCVGYSATKVGSVSR
jgi:ubiquinone/menaquinone biosynthesis C-methylase UbiE